MKKKEQLGTWVVTSLYVNVRVPTQPHVFQPALSTRTTPTSPLTSIMSKRINSLLVKWLEEGQKHIEQERLLAERTKTQPRLQDLPTELRQEIYRRVLGSYTGTIMLVRSSRREISRYKILTSSDAYDEPVELITLGLLRVSRQEYNDCKDMFWKYNTLDVENLPNISRFRFMN